MNCQASVICKLFSQSPHFKTMEKISVTTVTLLPYQGAEIQAL